MHQNSNRVKERKKKNGAVKEELTSKQCSIEELTLKTGWRQIYECHQLSIPSNSLAEIVAENVSLMIQSLEITYLCNRHIFGGSREHAKPADLFNV